MATNEDGLGRHAGGHFSVSGGRAS